MSRAKVNKLLALPPHQDRWLRKEAKRLGISVSELLRRLVDAAIAKEKSLE